MSTRALGRQDFRRIAHEGQRVAGRLLAVQVLGRDDDRVRVGFTAARRLGGAVRRNRSRRVLREAWRTLASRAGGGYDLVFVAMPSMGRCKVPEVAAEMERLLSRSGVIG